MGHGIIFSSGQRTPLSLVCGGSLAAAAVSWAAVAIGSKVMRRGLPENQDGNRDGDPVASKTKSENVEGEEGEPIPTIPGCPVGSSAKDASRVVRLYEAYIHLDGLRGKWECPFTSNPVLEPSFVAAMHGLELSFLLLANFLEDSRAYIVMQHRIELAAKDIASQVLLLADIVDMELTLPDPVAEGSKASLTQTFPFEGTKTRDVGRQSPGLALLLAAVDRNFDALSTADQHSLRKVVRVVTGSFASLTSHWSVGIGLEDQLRDLRCSVKLGEIGGLQRHNNTFLDYEFLCQPGLCLDTRKGATTEHCEDFFFRTVHLGTECWAFVALRGIDSAMGSAKAGRWHNAAAHLRAVAGILDYLGTHVMMLCGMMLADYLPLKVEIEGTSGAGSVQVKRLRSSLASLLEPLEAAAVDRILFLPGSDQLGNMRDSEDVRMDSLMEVYRAPGDHPELIDYIKALEEAESSLLGGFFYRHYLLACNVIGSDSHGTMKRAVQALKASFQIPIFPTLDRVRSNLGKEVDARLAHLQGRIMKRIDESIMPTSPRPRPSASLSDASTAIIAARDGDGYDDLLLQELSFSDREERRQASADQAREELYSTRDVPRGLLPDSGAVIQFLDHAFGQVPPKSGWDAAKRCYQLQQAGNTTYWHETFQINLPKASNRIMSMLNLRCSEDPDGGSHVVEWGHNSHELSMKLMSSKFAADGRLHVLTTDSEFFSITRQLNALSAFKGKASAQGSHLLKIDFVEVEPLSTFRDRFLEQVENGGSYNFIYLSQIAFSSQWNLVPDPSEFAHRVRAAVGRGWLANGNSADVASWEEDPGCAPYLILDAYHAFAAIPTSIDETAPLMYLAGLLKHASSGANAAFVVIPANVSLRPLVTGWLADSDVFKVGGNISLGDHVKYDKGLALMGGTASFGWAILTFTEVSQRWEHLGVSIQVVHDQVMSLQSSFMSRLPMNGPVSKQTLQEVQPYEIRSHTLVFNLKDAQAASDAVQAFLKEGVELDCRGHRLRMGFGFNHSERDIDFVLDAAEKVVMTTVHSIASAVEM